MPRPAASPQPRSPQRTKAAETTSAADFLPERHTLKALREAARTCRGCPLWQNATQTVFGEGDPHARLMLVGETPGDREDILLAAGAATMPQSDDKMAGIVLTGGLRPNEAILKALQTLPIPVLLAKAESYQVASKVHNLTVKTRPNDAEKISVIRNLIAQNVNVKKIIDSL